MPTWRALPTRQPGEALSSIEYRKEPEIGRAGERFVTDFRHRDNRVWQASISNSDIILDGDDTFYSYVILVTSVGCRSWRFLSTSMDLAKRTVSRFANMPLAQYERLIADAQGTTEYPKPGAMGVFRMQLVRQTQVAPGREEVYRSEISGIAYTDGTTIVVYPTTTELAELLSGVCATGTIALVPQGINQIPSADDTPGFADRSNLYGLRLPSVSTADLEAAINRLSSDTTESVLSGLSHGTYKTTPKPRDDRVLDIFDK